MEAGYVPDASHGTVFQLGWLPGTPQRRFLIPGVKAAQGQSWKITAYRCTHCGFLKLFAADEASGPSPKP